jgi:hypothetical protein
MKNAKVSYRNLITVAVLLGLILGAFLESLLPGVWTLRMWNRSSTT